MCTCNNDTNLFLVDVLVETRLESNELQVLGTEKITRIVKSNHQDGVKYVISSHIKKNTNPGEVRVILSMDITEALE